MTIREQIIEVLRLNMAPGVVDLAKDMLANGEFYAELLENYKVLNEKHKQLHSDNVELKSREDRVIAKEKEILQKEAKLEKQMFDLQITMLKERITAVESLVSKMFSSPQTKIRRTGYVPVGVSGGSASGFVGSGFVDIHEEREET